MAEATAVVRSNEDVVLSFIRENFGLNVNRDEFSKIDSPLFCAILAKFLDDFGVDNYLQLDLLAVHGVSDIEKYEETTQVINLWQAVAQILTPLGFNDFNLGDVLQPRKPRAMKAIIHLIHLWQKFSCVYSDWLKVEEQYAEIPERKRLIETENRELQRQLESKSCLLSKLRSQNSSQEQQLAVSGEEIAKLCAEGKELADESKSLKLELVTKKEELSQLTLDISQINEKIEELKSQIVHSPEKIVTETENKEKLLEDLRIEKLSLDKEYTLLSHNLQILESTLKQSQATMEVLSQTVADVDTFKEEIRKVENVKSELNAKKQKLVELSVIFQKHENNVEEIQKQMSIANLQHTQRQKPTKELNENLKVKLSELLECESKLAKEYTNEEKQILEQLKSADEEHEKFNVQLNKSKEVMYSKLNDYYKVLSNVTDGISHQKL